MAIFLLSLFGCASIGVYSLATEKIAVLPSQTPEKRANHINEWLGVKVVRTTIGGSLVVGALVCANSNGIVLPSYVKGEEVEAIKSVSEDTNLAIMETRRNAFGNMVLANDYGAICDPRLKTGTINELSDTLGVEVAPGEVAGLPYVGSLALATNKGVLAHPLIKEEEQKLLKEMMKVPVDLGTINCGIPYVSTGLIGNSSNVVAGSLTTGPEMFIIGQSLDVVK
ncbi:MAG: translation initiation factor IF-6 [Candidatus Bathyarchaeota archaeon]|nr:translation initiation factor IF-6 [Candidatus Bathyarchaeota archaeon]